MKIMMIYLFIINLISLALFLADSRLKIRTGLLLFISLIGGSVGAMFGIKALESRKKVYFFTGVIPAIVLMQVTGWIMYINMPWNY